MRLTFIFVVFSMVAAEEVIIEVSLSDNVDICTRPESVAVAPFGGCAKQPDLQKKTSQIIFDKRQLVLYLISRAGLEGQNEKAKMILSS